MKIEPPDLALAYTRLAPLVTEAHAYMKAGKTDEAAKVLTQARRFVATCAATCEIHQNVSESPLKPGPVWPYFEGDPFTDDEIMLPGDLTKEELETIRGWGGEWPPKAKELVKMIEKLRGRKGLHDQQSLHDFLHHCPRCNGKLDPTNLQFCGHCNWQDDSLDIDAAIDRGHAMDAEEPRNCE